MNVATLKQNNSPTPRLSSKQHSRKRYPSYPINHDAASAFVRKAPPVRPTANIGWRVVVQTQKILKDQATAQQDLCLQKRVLCRNLLRRLQQIAARTAASRRNSDAAATTSAKPAAAASANDTKATPEPSAPNAVAMRNNLTKSKALEQIIVPGEAQQITGEADNTPAGEATADGTAAAVEADDDADSDSSEASDDGPPPTKAELKQLKKLAKGRRKALKAEKRKNKKGMLGFLKLGRSRGKSSTDSSSTTSSSSLESMGSEVSDSASSASSNDSETADTTVFV